jgi:hypothetical protein
MLASSLAPPASLVACNIGCGAFGKRWRLLGVLLPQRVPLIAFVLERVYPIIKLLATFLRLLASALKADVRVRTQAGPMTAASDRVSKEP